MKKKQYKYLIILCISVIIFNLPLFKINEITVQGIEYYTKEEVLKATSIEEDMHVLMLRKSKIKEEVEELSYIDKVDVTYRFPGKVNLVITERYHIGYIEFGDTYLYLDKNGYVIEQSEEAGLGVPAIEGISIEKFTLGERIITEASLKLQVVTEINQILRKYSFEKDVDVIDVTNIEQIHLYVDSLNVIIGNIRDFDKKIRYLIEVNKQYATGILDLSLIEYDQAILRPVN